MKPQNIEVLRNLRSGPITAMDMHRHGIYRLASRIHDLRSTGHDIKTYLVTVNGKRFARYVLMLTIVLLAGCSTNPKNITAAYVSPIAYSNYNCDQLFEEMSHITRQNEKLYSSLKKRNTKDKWAMGVGMILFWPTLFALSGGDGAEASQYASIQGEAEAVRKAIILNNCNIPKIKSVNSYNSIKLNRKKSGRSFTSDSNYIPLKESKLRNGETVIIGNRK